MVREEFLRLLREDAAFREEVRRQVLTDELLALPGRTEENFTRAFELIRQAADLISGLAEAVEAFRAEMHEEFLRVWSSLRSLTERVDRLAEDVSRLTERVNQLAERLDQLTERVNRLAERLDQLTERVNQLAERLDQLTERVNRLAERLDQLTERVNRLAERLDQLTERVNRLAERLDQLTERVNQLTEDVNRLTVDVDRLTSVVRGLSEDVGRLKGWSLESRWRERAPAYLGRYFRRVRVLSVAEVQDLIDEALERGAITEEEAADLRQADILVRAMVRGPEPSPLLAVVEVSWTVSGGDVRRVRRWAGLLERMATALGLPERRVTAVAAGHEAAGDALKVAERLGVAVFVDGREATRVLRP